MVRIDKVVTKGGDTAETSLGDGSRVSKTDPRIEAMGAVDETNAAIGVLRLYTRGRTVEDTMMERIQNDLFDIGADLSAPAASLNRLRISDIAVARLETEVIAMNTTLPALKSFILPGGTEAGAFAHLARVAARRAERAAAAVGDVNPIVLRYLNRLSDHLFVLARTLNDDGTKDVLWSPGASWHRRPRS